jgi:hypothetical protein
MKKDKNPLRSMYLGRRRKARASEDASASPVPATTLLSLKKEFDELKVNYDQLLMHSKALTQEIQRLKNNINAVRSAPKPRERR